MIGNQLDQLGLSERPDAGLEITKTFSRCIDTNNCGRNIGDEILQVRL
jgi:hypothetical protein